MYKTVGIRNLLPAPDSVTTMRALARFGATSVISSRPPWGHEDTQYWLRAYFKRAITGNVHFTRNHYYSTTTAHLPTKSEVCVREGINYLFEDDPQHAVPCADAGVQTLLFYYYGERLPEHQNIHRVYSWLEALTKIKQLEKI